MELLNTHTVEQVQEIIREIGIQGGSLSQTVALEEGLHRCLAEPIQSPHDIPAFPRSTVDGFAVRASDTFGAEESIPAMLQCIGEVEMGKPVSIHIHAGECAYVPTGGMIPEGSDAVVMTEYVEEADKILVLVYQSVSPGANVLAVGEDISAGKAVFQAGHRLRPQDLGLLAGMGYDKISVTTPLKAAVISTGNELIPPGEPLVPGKIIDMNTYSLQAALKEDGFIIAGTAVVGDQRQDLENAINHFMKKADIILVSGGSSMGVHDVTREAIDAMGDPGVIVHGMAVKPGKPTIVGMAEQVLILGLPGQPVSALVVYHLLVRPLAMEKNGALHPREAMCILTENVPSAPGKEHWVMVKISSRNGVMTATPVHGKSGMLSMMADAAGMFQISVNQEGLPKGECVKVILF